MDLLEKGWKVIKWVGNIIFRVVSWFFGEIRDMIENEVKAFLQASAEKIKKALNIGNTLKVLVIKKMLSKLAEMAKKYYKELTSHDQNIIDELLANDPNCPI